MNILLLPQNYYPFVGGVETHVRQVAHELGARHAVRVAAMNFAPCRLPSRFGMLNTSLLAPSCDSYQDGEIPVCSLTPSLTQRLWMLPIALRAVPRLQRHAYHGLNRFGYRWFRRAYLPKMRQLIRGVDVVHSHAGGYVGWAAQEAAREQGIPFVITPYVHPHQWGDGPEDIAYYNRADVVIGLVASDRDYLESIGVPAEKLRVIGVSPDLPESADPTGFRHAHGIGAAPLVLYVGRMMPQKGAKGVLESAEQVWKTYPGARFVFIGPASETEKALFAGQDPRIRYLGKVSAQEKADALAACDIFCMPSLSEILPTVYLEAWSYGKPVVGGMAHGLPELVEGSGAGIAVSQDPVDISGALVRLLADSALRARQGAAGCELVARQYAKEAVASALEEQYRQLIVDGAARTRAPQPAALAYGPGGA